MSGEGIAGTDPVAAHLERLTRLPEVQRRLLAAASVGELFSRGAELACTECGFTRGVVVSVEPGQLTATETDALSDRASDTLRRRLLAEPVDLMPGAPESELIRRAGGTAESHPRVSSVLEQKLGLRHHALGVVAPESRALALLVVDRAEPPLDPFDHGIVGAFAAMLAVALEHIVLRARISELSQELRHLTASAQALMAEVLEAPVSLPSGRRHGPTFLRVDVVDPLSENRLQELFSDREREIAALLVQGRTNREIADRLILSPETVKDYVTRILRKLGATNRVEAVSRYLRLTQPPSS